MNKQKALKIVNTIMVIDFAVIAITAILHEIIIPTGIYDIVHAVPGFLLLALVIIHVYLNWAWVRKNILSSFIKTK